MRHTIRVAIDADFDRIVEIFDHPKIVPESSQHPYLGYEKIVHLFDKSRDHSIVLVGEVEGVVAGYLKLELNIKPRSKHVAAIGMAVHPDFQGKGLGHTLLKTALDQADNWLNIIRVELDVYTDNEKAIALYKKLGFEIEGEARLASYKNGRYVGLLRMARLRE